MAVIKINNKQFNLGLMSVKTDTPLKLVLLGTGKSKVIIEGEGGNAHIVLLAKAYNEIRSRIAVGNIVDITDIIDLLRKEPSFVVIESIRSAKQREKEVRYFSYMATLLAIEEPYNFSWESYSLKEGGYEVKVSTKPIHGVYFSYYLKFKQDKYHVLNSFKNMEDYCNQLVASLNDYTRYLISTTNSNYIDLAENGFNHLNRNFDCSEKTMALKKKNTEIQNSTGVVV